MSAALGDVKRSIDRPMRHALPVPRYRASKTFLQRRRRHPIDELSSLLRPCHTWLFVGPVRHHPESNRYGGPDEGHNLFCNGPNARELAGSQVDAVAVDRLRAGYG